MDFLWWCIHCILQFDEWHSVAVTSCRVLYNEGGYYFDVDLYPVVDIRSALPASTEFTSCYEPDTTDRVSLDMVLNWQSSSVQATFFQHRTSIHGILLCVDRVCECNKLPKYLYVELSLFSDYFMNPTTREAEFANDFNPYSNSFKWTACSHVFCEINLHPTPLPNGKSEVRSFFCWFRSLYTPLGR